MQYGESKYIGHREMFLLLPRKVLHNARRGGNAGERELKQRFFVSMRVMNMYLARAQANRARIVVRAAWHKKMGS